MRKSSLYSSIRLVEILNFLNTYWVILVALGTIVGNWYLIRNQMKLFDLRLRHLEQNSDTRNERDAETRAKLAVIEANLANINANLSEIKADLRRVSDSQK